MPPQIYRCGKHGEFEVEYNIAEDICRLALCPHGKCGRAGVWVPQAVAFHVNGGTGAQRHPR